MNELEIQAPEEKEIIDDIAHMENNKRPGENGILARILKEEVIDSQNQIVELIQDIYIRQQVPKQWSNALLCLVLHKKVM